MSFITIIRTTSDMEKEEGELTMMVLRKILEDEQKSYGRIIEGKQQSILQGSETKNTIVYRDMTMRWTHMSGLCGVSMRIAKTATYQTNQDTIVSLWCMVPKETPGQHQHFGITFTTTGVESLTSQGIRTVLRLHTNKGLSIKELPENLRKRIRETKNRNKCMYCGYVY